MLPHSSSEGRRLFVDLSVIRSDDAGTGIQRVVRGIGLAFLELDLRGWDLQFVAATRKKGYFRIDWPIASDASDLRPIAARPGDIFLGLDYSLDMVRWHRKQLAKFRQNGGLLWFLVHDLLPLNRPDWFSGNTVIRYRTWLKILAGLADGFLCNSAQTEEELLAAMGERYGLYGEFATQILPMGSDIKNAPWPGSSASEAVAPLRDVFCEPFTMMVGTLEPRKGHDDVLDAYDLLWARGSAERLILVGRPGWHIDQLKSRIAQHPALGQKLLWFDDLGDEELALAYGACCGVIVGSFAEGYGLPIIEALGYGKPVLARDLAVFRAHEGNGVRFFPADATAATLATCVEQWSAAVQANEIAVTPPRQGWQEAGEVLLSTLISRKLPGLSDAVPADTKSTGP